MKKELSQDRIENISGGQGINWGSPHKLVEVKKGQTIWQVLSENGLNVKQYENQLQQRSDIFNRNGEAYRDAKIWIQL